MLPMLAKLISRSIPDANDCYTEAIATLKSLNAALLSKSLTPTTLAAGDHLETI